MDSLQCILQVTFLQLLSKARVTYAQRLLENDPNLTIVDLAERVGFNSKTTLYSAFSKHVGVTPAKFKAQLS